MRICEFLTLVEFLLALRLPLLLCIAVYFEIDHIGYLSAVCLDNNLHSIFKEFPIQYHSAAQHYARGVCTSMLHILV